MNLHTALLCFNACLQLIELQWPIVSTSLPFSHALFKIEIKIDSVPDQTKPAAFIQLTLFISATVFWTSGSPSRFMLRCRLTGGTVKLTNPCSSASSNTVAFFTLPIHTDPHPPTWQPWDSQITCQHLQTNSCCIQAQWASQKRARTHARTQTNTTVESIRPSHFCCHQLTGVAIVIAVRSWPAWCAVGSVIDGYFRYWLCVCALARLHALS